MPNCSFAFAAQVSVDGSSEMSVCTNAASPSFSSCSIAEAARSSLISATTTFAPSSRKRLAYARPMPWPAPVMIATLSSSRPMFDAPCTPAYERWMRLKRSVTTGSPLFSSRHTVSVTMNVIVRPLLSFS